MPELSECSHCNAPYGVVHGLIRFYCNSCGWWGSSPDAMTHNSGAENGWSDSCQRSGLSAREATFELIG
jgi:hypothetical protein